MDDLTVRTGRVVDGKFYTDSVADQVRQSSSQVTPQSPESANGGVGFQAQARVGQARAS